LTACSRTRGYQAIAEYRQAIEQYCQADELWQEKESPARINALWGWGWALRQQEKFDEGTDKFRRAVEVVPRDFGAVYRYGLSLAELGSYRDAIEQFDKPDQFQIGVDHLSYALEYGWHREAGLKRLSISETAKIYYVRGYARTKSYEADASRATLTLALKDFQKCKELDPKDSKEPAAIEKITKFMRRGMRESLLEVWGPLVISIFGALVFLFLQLDFFFPGKLLSQHSPTDAMGAEASRRSSPGSRRSGWRR
jgi:tetratricopeptide (TPR) repeat protein